MGFESFSSSWSPSSKLAPASSFAPSSSSKQQAARGNQQPQIEPPSGLRRPGAAVVVHNGKPLRPQRL
ncbi:hypothetical protein DAI22_08g121100 [Oryza sativa Japonica Group]|nr:hypothetical protein DAI22_08g121100 [Oryza sativa Japonica Group]